MNALPAEEIKEHLRGRVAQLETDVESLSAHRTVQLDSGVPRRAAAIIDHSIVHFEAELAWTRDLLEKVEWGEYP